MTRLSCCSVLLLTPVFVGCTSPTASLDMQQRVIANADPEVVLAAARVMLAREFGRVRVEPEARRIEAGPAEYSTHSDSGTARDLVGARSTMRRKASFSLGRAEKTQVVARLRVEIERKDTQRQAFMRPPGGERISDTPGQQTPIDADAATSYEQNTVWTRVRRDTRLEQALLEELRERFARQTVEPEGTPVVEPLGDEPAPAPDTRN